jgi:hypothetical protein
LASWAKAAKPATKHLKINYSGCLYTDLTTTIRKNHETCFCIIDVVRGHRLGRLQRHPG